MKVKLCLLLSLTIAIFVSLIPVNGLALAADTSSRNSQASFQQGVKSFQKQDYLQAIIDFSQAIQLNPQFA
ncbi:MAG: hypothetical protein F6K32_22705, partial [Desertifilum sp. SIO1I2]|nr:hypothetical protein [Desertifilum sp. SIO1I2]